MKKILLGTTALVSAGLVAGPALAGDPLSVSVSGSVVTGFYVTDADSVGASSKMDTKTALVARNIDIIAEGTLDNGMTAGVDAKLQLGSDWNTATNSNANFRQLFAYLEGGFGRFEIGGVDGAAYKMHYTSPWFVPGNGVDSPNIYNGVAANAAGTAYTGSSSVPLSTFSLMATDANKVTYFTPRFAGFQLGVSYTPDLSNGFQPAANGLGLSTKVSGNISDVFEVAANYAGTLAGVDVGLDGFYVDGDGNLSNTDPKEYGFGGSLGYMGFTLGGAWTKREDITVASIAPVAGKETDTWTAGLSYGTGPWTVGVAYINSKDESSALVASKGAETEAWQVGGGYSLGSGVDLGLDVQFASDKAASGAKTYDATSGGLVLAVSF